MERSRRTFVKSGAGLVALSALAGCSEGDTGNGNGNGGEDAGSEPQTEPDTAVVSILAENLDSGHDHDHDDDHDDDHHDDDHDDEGLVSQAVLEEACGHMEFDDPESVVGGGSTDETPVISGTHQPFDVSVEGDSAFITYDADADGGHDHEDEHDDDHEDEHDDDHEDEHDDDHEDEHENGMFGFFAYGGEISVHAGEVHEEGHDVGCDAVERYVAVEPDHGVVTLELTPNA